MRRTQHETNKWTKNRIKIFMLVIAFAAILVGCNTANTEQSSKVELPISESYFIFDTIVSVRVYDERMDDAHFESIKAILEHIDETMNRFKEKSEVAHINQLAGQSAVKVSEETFNIIQTAKSYAISSGGKFDPTVGPLVDLWAIGNGGSVVPSDEAIEAAKQLVDYDKLILDKHNLTVELKDKGMTLDLGAIAKGYAADKVAQYLQEQDFHSAIIDLGGNIVAMGSKPNQTAWSIGIQSPEENRGAYLGTLSVEDKTIVTSGIYERYFTFQDKQYHHVLDPFTGFPASHELVSVTIITDESMHADAMSTATFLLGLEEGTAFIEAMDNSEAIFVTRDYKVHLTSGLKDKFKLTRDDYKLVE